MTRFAAVLIVAALAAPSFAQPVNLAEKVAAGDRGRCAVELELKGKSESVSVRVLQAGSLR